MTPQLLFTGATSFVGKAVCEQAVRHGIAIKVALRKRGEVPGCMESLWLVKSMSQQIGAVLCAM